jgi:hypothetical protein
MYFALGPRADKWLARLKNWMGLTVAVTAAPLVHPPGVTRAADPRMTIRHAGHQSGERYMERKES